MHIEEKLALAAREDAIKSEATDKQMLLDDLLKTHASIEEKYNIARGKLENARMAFENAQKRHTIKSRMPCRKSGIVWRMSAQRAEMP